LGASRDERFFAIDVFSIADPRAFYARGANAQPYTEPLVLTFAR